MTTSLRAYHPSDKNECMNAFKSNVPLFFTVEEIEEFENFLTRLDSGIVNTQFFVVIHNQQLIGCGGFGDRENTNIYSLAWGLIHKDYHKKGFGKQLLIHRLEEIKKLNLTVPVIIDTTQHSYGFFEKYGFRTTKITLDYYTKGMHRYDMIWE